MGRLLVFLTALGMSSARILFYISLPNLSDPLLRLPFAIAADRFGKKTSRPPSGVGLKLLGFALITASGWAPRNLIEPIFVAGLVIFSIGSSMFVAGWFALLSPIVPESIRGRFFRASA